MLVQNPKKPPSLSSLRLQNAAENIICYTPAPGAVQVTPGRSPQLQNTKHQLAIAPSAGQPP
ncbi:hypothetical protein A2U01_0083764, partial [Trifolium medium]|nr:hypothetical protein [Trifolium medium]